MVSRTNYNNLGPNNKMVMYIAVALVVLWWLFVGSCGCHGYDESVGSSVRARVYPAQNNVPKTQAWSVPYGIRPGKLPGINHGTINTDVAKYLPESWLKPRKDTTQSSSPSPSPSPSKIPKSKLWSRLLDPINMKRLRFRHVDRPSYINILPGKG